MDDLSKPPQVAVPTNHGETKMKIPAILLATSLLTGSVAFAADREKPAADIIDTAVAAGQFTTLAKALTAAGLIDALKGDGPFTVFAPTNEAFAKIPAAKLEALLADKEALTRVLTYHVVPGKLMAVDVVGMKTAKSLAGPTLAIDASDGVRIDRAKVIEADVLASNGVIHVIDTVLMPR
jgi:uncharacterized surface protein with fasciclin (FAS1) repeats